ncbi:MAG: hypothetical protein GTN36_04485 [Candidatus Aenigmarchaeota archaeon]|nr:hypothetical protein [Candidatus Aenigmarchaeota archaeon]
MKLRFLIIFLFVFFAIFSIPSLSESVGVSPVRINLGEVERGSTKLVNFYVISPSEKTLLVKLEPERSSLDSIGKYLITNFSEEDISPWIKIINNPVELRPANETLKTTGGLIRGQREISFLIEIPNNSESGYHAINIKPVPLESPETTAPVGGRVVAVVSVKVLFDIIGNALRRGIILDTETGNYVGDRLEINNYFQNTGTVTISATGTQKIYDKGGNLKEVLFLGKKYIKPKEIKVFKGFLPTTGLSLGDYDAYTVIDYTTGKAEKSSIITLTTPPPTALAVKAEEGLFIPLLIIIIIVIFVVSVIIYRRT